MSTSELQRLALALGQDHALRQTLAAELAPCRSLEDAAARLQSHGYAIEAADLQASRGQLPGQPSAGPPSDGAALPDAALDGVTGGASFISSSAVPFTDKPGQVIDPWAMLASLSAQLSH
ncbi:Nif11-like leader peptide family natural product precursor [Pseudoroseomonas cervicalis]|uniref:Nif11-like leader peptide family natural product precursor n=1 Tax=Teichococcus cervicalis TaxID=204525 RepID=UPI0027831383|nr:Nif11-like leader peptide family natural product precursor [Pseudoroseomonas cervicalis]MDQ1080994.1 hypothetical protein [Pseudoroseomonas cervicalis]